MGYFVNHLFWYYRTEHTNKRSIVKLRFTKELKKDFSSELIRWLDSLYKVPVFFMLFYVTLENDI